MIVEFRCERGRARRWMADAALVQDHGAGIRLVWTEATTPAPAGLDTLFELERILLRKGKPSGADRLGAIPEMPHAAGEADVVVDFTGVGPDPACQAKLYLRPLFDGIAGEDAVLTAILAGDLPVVDIINDRDGTVLDRGHPSGEIAIGLSGALDAVMARTLTLIRAVLSGKPRIIPQLARRSHGPVPPHPAPFVVRGLAVAIAKEVYRLCCYAPHWHVGWRYSDTADVWKAGDLSGPGWQVLPDPGSRFYADPFPITWMGRTFVFFEDLDHRVGKGIISAVEFDGAGPVGDVIPVLEEPWHLSYPFLIEHDQQLWMIPES